MTNKIEFTESAKKEIERGVAEKGSQTYFRIRVQGGGCSGFKYNFSFDDKVKNEDRVFNKTLIDKNSLKIIHVHFYDYLLRIDVNQCDQSYTHWSKWLLGV